MFTTLRIVLLLILTFFLQLAPVTAWQGSPVAPDARVGRKIMIIRAGAEMRTPEKTVWRSYLGEVFTVAMTNGEWLWIHEKGGWLWEKEAVMFDTAIEEASSRLIRVATAENYHLRGVAYLAHGEYDKAIADFSESLRKLPRNAGALNNRGQANYLKGDYRAAVTDFGAAILIDEKNFLALNNRALCYIETEEYRLAMVDLNNAIEIVPDYPEALNNRGITHEKLNELDEAIKDFDAALRIDARYVDALGNRAYAWQRKKEYLKAIADLELAMKISPTTFEAVNDLAWLLATCPEDTFRSPTRSLELAKTACTLTEYKQWNTLDTLAAAYAENGQFDDAKTWLGTSLSLAPEKEKSRIQLHLDLVVAQKPIRQQDERGVKPASLRKRR